MAKKTLTEAFEVKSTQTPKKDLKDYDIFGDKGLLDSLRTKIVQNLIEENIPDDGLLEDYINNEQCNFSSLVSPKDFFTNKKNFNFKLERLQN